MNPEVPKHEAPKSLEEQLRDIKTQEALLSFVTRNNEMIPSIKQGIIQGIFSDTLSREDLEYSFTSIKNQEIRIKVMEVFADSVLKTAQSPKGFISKMQKLPVLFGAEGIPNSEGGFYNPAEVAEAAQRYFDGESTIKLPRVWGIRENAARIVDERASQNSQ